jgi:multimeric flavodoxin WrbA
LDAYVFVTPEYNHAPSAALKYAIDFICAEWNSKSAGFRQLRQRRRRAAFKPNPIHETSLSTMLDQAVAWGEAMKVLRRR